LLAHAGDGVDAGIQRFRDPAVTSGFTDLQGVHLR
jgi:hypothetical protein